MENLNNFVWSVAEILRGDFKQSEYGRVILPFVVLRRLDCILEPSKDVVLKANDELPEDVDDTVRDVVLFKAVGNGVKAYNLSRFNFQKLKGQDPQHLHDNLVDYITKFSPSICDIFIEKFRFTDQLKRLNDANLLWNVFERFCEIDLHPDRISNTEMGNLFEELIRRFSEISNETAGHHFTPREVIRLIVDLIVAKDDPKLTGRGIIRQVYDPACGTGGMLALTEQSLKDFNSNIHVELFGQEINAESFAICQSDILITGHNPEEIAFGNTLTHDAHDGKRFHYMLSNPPYGVNWAKYRDLVEEEAEKDGPEGRYGAGLPQTRDGQLLFLQHMISKMRVDDTGSRIGIVMNESPLFNGDAGSGVSEIRRWMFENDWVDAIVALPANLFYNTPIRTYIWILTNRKPKNQKGMVQLIDASGERFWKPMAKSLGDKRCEIPKEARHEIVRMYSEFINGDSEENDASKVFQTIDFGHRRIRVERPLRLNVQVNEERLSRLNMQKAFTKLADSEKSHIRNMLSSIGSTLFKNRAVFEKALNDAMETKNLKMSSPVKKAVIVALSERDKDAEICTDKKGNPEPDAELRDYELVPLQDDWHRFLRCEVTPFEPDAWVDESYTDAKDGGVGRVGYEINFNRYFCRYVAPRPVKEVDNELRVLEKEISELLSEVVN